MKQHDKQQAKYILAIDHGTSGIKTAIVSIYGKVMDFAFQPTSLNFLPDGGIEQDPLQWWQAALNTCKTLVLKQTVDPADIVAICVSSTFSTTVAVDKHGDPVCPAITWMDGRGAPYVRQAMQGKINFQGYGVKKIWQWLPKTAGCPSLSGKDDIGHVLFLKHRHPDIYKNTYMFLPSKDFINLKLTGEFAASYDSIHLFWVTDIRDVGNVCYDRQLIQSIGIDGDKLPPLRHSTAVLGTLRESVARQIGVSSDVKVIAGSPDHQSACVGSGAVRDFEGHIYIGTSSWAQCLVPFKKTDPLHIIATFPTAVPDRYQCINEQDIAGGCLTFLFDKVLCVPKGENPFDHLDEKVNSVPAGSHRLLFTPWLNGERTPVDDPYLRGGWFNISMNTTQNDMIRSVLEGVAFNTRWSLTYVEKMIGRKMDHLNIIGGGGKSNAWCQIFADILNREIRQVNHPLKANARGAAFIASVGLGYIRFSDIPDLIEYEKIYKPQPEHRHIYDELFLAFLSLHKHNKSLFRKLNQKSR